MTARRIHRRLPFIALLFALGLLAAPAAAPAAIESPFLTLDIHHEQTNFAPGDDGETSRLTFDLRNVGDANTAGPISLTVTLSGGLKRASAGGAFQLSNGWAKQLGKSSLPWSCPGAPGDTSITCTTAGPIPRHTLDDALSIRVSVPPGLKAGQTRTVTATVSGGGAPEAPSAAGCPPASAACATESLPIDPEAAPFGVLPQSFTPDFFAADGQTPARRAGQHPDQFVLPFDFASHFDPETISKLVPQENIRDLTIDFPPGFLGDPTAVPECPAALFTIGNCPADTQVGRIDVRLAATFSPPIRTGLFNLAHPRDTVSDIAFAVLANPVHTKVHLDPADRYAITSTTADINETLPALYQRVTLWGVPADHSHDSERCPGGFQHNDAFVNSNNNGDTSQQCAVTVQPRPFLTAPSQCQSDNVFAIHHYDSWQDTGDFGPELDYTMPGHQSECEVPRFEPEVQIEPTGHQANTPTGLDLHVQIAQNQSPYAPATPPVQRFTVTLPQGMSFSPSFADGLSSCTLAQMELGNDDPVQCPDASRIGEVTLHSPLLPKAAEGSMYLAAPGDNPFGSTFALLLVVHDTEERGVLIKIPGRIDVDEQTGQITTVFEDTPQLPFDDLALKFRSGPRAPLVNPPSCGSHTIAVEVASYAQPDVPVDASNTYSISEGPGGTPCPPDSAHRPFAPDFSGGTLNPLAGSYSTFLFRLNRSDDEQELSQVSTFLPPGLLAKIAGIPFCPDAALASISTELGAGAAEQASPACPAASQIGTVSAGLGAGPGPNYFPGKVYLAGPYKGAPLSLAIVAPGLAGPFDLGNVAVRVALRVDPETSRVTAVSDPFPTILHGVILRVRDVRLRLDRPETTLNPTNCTPTTLDATITGVGGDLLSTADDSLFNASDYFQVGDCGRLPFKPKLFFKLKGGTHRGDHPAFTARLIGRSGDANIARAITALPRSEFLENAHIGTVCTRVQFKADECPPASIYGHAKAITPLLDDPVEGDLVLRSSDHPLPDLVARLRGQISANLVGRIDSINGGIRTSFETVPDVPVTEFTLTMAGGSKGLLVNSQNLCKATHSADVKFTSQSNKFFRLRPLMQTSCKKKGKRRSKRHARNH